MRLTINLLLGAVAFAVTGAAIIGSVLIMKWLWDTLTHNFDLSAGAIIVYALILMGGLLWYINNLGDDIRKAIMRRRRGNDHN